MRASFTGSSRSESMGVLKSGGGRQTQSLSGPFLQQQARSSFSGPSQQGAGAGGSGPAVHRARVTIASPVNVAAARGTGLDYSPSSEIANSNIQMTKNELGGPGLPRSKSKSNLGTSLKYNSSSPSQDAPTRQESPPAPRNPYDMR